MVQPPGKITPSKGKLFVPLTEAEKEQNRIIKANSYSTGSGSNGSASSIGGAGGMHEAQEPMTFMHLKTWGRNYAVLQVWWGWRFRTSHINALSFTATRGINVPPHMHVAQHGFEFTSDVRSQPAAV